MSDEYAGQGGSYVIDRKGKRVLVERTTEADPVSSEPEAAVPADQPSVDDGVTDGGVE